MRPSKRESTGWDLWQAAAITHAAAAASLPSRFSAGNSGVYFAARDLFISELSGRFDLDMELVTRPDGSRVSRVTIALGGAAGDDEEDAE